MARVAARLLLATLVLAACVAVWIWVVAVIGLHLEAEAQEPGDPVEGTRVMFVHEKNRLAVDTWLGPPTNTRWPREGEFRIEVYDQATMTNLGTYRITLEEVERLDPGEYRPTEPPGDG